MKQRMTFCCFIFVLLLAISTHLAGVLGKEENVKCDDYEDSDSDIYTGNGKCKSGWKYVQGTNNSACIQVFGKVNYEDAVKTCKDEDGDILGDLQALEQCFDGGLHDEVGTIWKGTKEKECPVLIVKNKVEREIPCRKKRFFLCGKTPLASSSQSKTTLTTMTATTTTTTPMTNTMKTTILATTAKEASSCSISDNSECAEGWFDVGKGICLMIMPVPSVLQSGNQAEQLCNVMQARLLNELDVDLTLLLQRVIACIDKLNIPIPEDQIMKQSVWLQECKTFEFKGSQVVQNDSCKAQGVQLLACAANVGEYAQPMTTSMTTSTTTSTTTSMTKLETTITVESCPDLESSQCPNKNWTDVGAGKCLQVYQKNIRFGYEAQQQCQMERSDAHLLTSEELRLIPTNKIACFIGAEHKLTKIPKYLFSIFKVWLDECKAVLLSEPENISKADSSCSLDPFGFLLCAVDVTSSDSTTTIRTDNVGLGKPTETQSKSYKEAIPHHELSAQSGGSEKQTTTDKNFQQKKAEHASVHTGFPFPTKPGDAVVPHPTSQPDTTEEVTDKATTSSEVRHSAAGATGQRSTSTRSWQKIEHISATTSTPPEGATGSGDMGYNDNSEEDSGQPSSEGPQGGNSEEGPVSPGNAYYNRGPVSSHKEFDYGVSIPSRDEDESGPRSPGGTQRDIEAQDTPQTGKDKEFAETATVLGIPVVVIPVVLVTIIAADIIAIAVYKNRDRLMHHFGLLPISDKRDLKNAEEGNVDADVNDTGSGEAKNEDDQGEGRASNGIEEQKATNEAEAEKPGEEGAATKSGDEDDQKASSDEKGEEKAGDGTEEKTDEDKKEEKTGEDKEEEKPGGEKGGESSDEKKEEKTGEDKGEEKPDGGKEDKSGDGKGEGKSGEEKEGEKSLDKQACEKSAGSNTEEKSGEKDAKAPDGEKEEEKTSAEKEKKETSSESDGEKSDEGKGDNSEDSEEEDND